MYLALIPTLVGIAVCIGLFFLARWRAGQPVRPERGPRMIPWTFLAIMAAAFCVALLAHLVQLFGVDPEALRPRRM